MITTSQACISHRRAKHATFLLQVSKQRDQVNYDAIANFPFAGTLEQAKAELERLGFCFEDEVVLRVLMWFEREDD